MNLSIRKLEPLLEPIAASLCAAALAALIPSAGIAGHAAQIELRAFESITLSDRAFLDGDDEEHAPVLLTGELRIPTPGTQRLPAVVLVHGSGGISGYIADWAEELNAQGYATFMIDGFSGRGLASVLADQALLGRLNLIVDAYRARELLAVHPRIDAARIALVGFSRGGQAALYAAMLRFQQLHAQGGSAPFAAYAAFYPDCGTEYREGTSVTRAPMLIVHGSADDMNPVAPCRAHVEQLRAAGSDVRLMELEGAHHVFDWPALAEPLRIPSAVTMRGCRLLEVDRGRILNRVTGRPFTYSDPCVERGATFAYDAEAHEAARAALRELLATAFAQ